jgi:hypothetical protein
VSRISLGRPARSAAVAAAIAAVLAAMVPAGAAAQAREAAAAGFRGGYVALGDSYTSGPTHARSAPC